MKRFVTMIGLSVLLTITILSAPAVNAATHEDALIVRGGGYTQVVHEDGSRDNVPNPYTYFRMSPAGKLSAFTPQAMFSRQKELLYNPDIRFITLFVPSDRVEVIDTVAGSDTFYPLPAGVTMRTNNGNPPQQAVQAFFIPLNGDKQLLLYDVGTGPMPEQPYYWYILDLASGEYTNIDMSKANRARSFHPFYQSPTDGWIYAEWYCQCDGGPGGIMRYDLQGHSEVVDLHLGNYIRSTPAKVSPAGKYLYFSAFDPNQPTPHYTGPWVDANVILRYRLSDGNLSVVARAAAHNILGSYTLTSPDDYLTYTEYTTVQDDENSYHTTSGTIKRVNLATKSQGQTIVSGKSLGNPLWCGSNLYYSASDDQNKAFTIRYNLTTHKTVQAEGQLVGCAP